MKEKEPSGERELSSGRRQEVHTSFFPFLEMCIAAKQGRRKEESRVESRNAVVQRGQGVDEGIT